MKEARAYYKKYYKCVELWANNGVGYTKCFRRRQGLKGCLKEIVNGAPDTDEIAKPAGIVGFLVSAAPTVIVQEYQCFRGARRIK
jgi:hypothetical protein